MKVIAPTAFNSTRVSGTSDGRTGSKRTVSGRYHWCYSRMLNGDVRGYGRSPAMAEYTNIGAWGLNDLNSIWAATFRKHTLRKGRAAWAEKLRTPIS